MDDTEQKKPSSDAMTSPLAAEPTYGERKYHFIFDQLINFWLNLAVSAAFTYWVTHSQKPFKMLGKQFAAPSEIQRDLANWIYHSRPMRTFGVKGEYDAHNPPSTLRARAAGNAANTFTLVTAGHPIMILSVWLGAKIKAPLVEWFNRRHYGDAAMETSDLKARHLAIEAEERPTFFGAVIGRLGTIMATQFTTYTIGNPGNIFNLYNLLGKKGGFSFPGMDKIAEVFGDHAGMAVQDLGKGPTDALDRNLASNNKFDWSTRQIQEKAAKLGVSNEIAKQQLGPYKNAAQHMGKYLAQDVLYSAVTAASIGPALNFFKKFIPGITYRPVMPQAVERKAEVLENELHIAPDPIADVMNNGINTPQKRISNVALQPSMMTVPNGAQAART